MPDAEGGWPPAAGAGAGRERGRGWRPFLCSRVTRRQGRWGLERVSSPNLKFARRVGNRGYIIEKGTIRHEARLEDLWAYEEAVRKYLAV